MCAACDGIVAAMCRALVILLQTTKRRRRRWGEKSRRGGQILRRSAKNVCASGSFCFRVTNGFEEAVIDHQMCVDGLNSTHSMFYALDKYASPDPGAEPPEHNVLFRVRWEPLKVGAAKNQRDLSYIHMTGADRNSNKHHSPVHIEFHYRAVSANKLKQARTTTRQRCNTSTFWRRSLNKLIRHQHSSVWLAVCRPPTHVW